MVHSSRKNFCLINSHFFQPILPDFHTNFTIPKSFLKYVGGRGENEEADEKIAILRNNRVDNFWLVKVGYFDDDKLHFKDGWNKFCEDHGLQVGDFLVFRHHKNLVFDVFIFDPTACERPFPGFCLPTSEKVKSSSFENPAKKGICKKGKGLKRIKENNDYCSSMEKVTFNSRGHPFCQTTVKPYCLKWRGIILPMNFAKENDLANKWCDITLIDQSGKAWQLPLRYTNHKRASVYIGGWSKFHRGNGLKDGDHVVFELIAAGEKPIMNFYKLG